MTYHEILAVLKVAEESHKKPEAEGGHGSPLNLNCFLASLHLNARTLGYPPGYLMTQFRNKFPILVKKGWIALLPKCGVEFFELSSDGFAKLEEWNLKGCADHSNRKTQRYGRECQGRAALKAPNYGHAAA
jgi:hypothetical protein